MQPQFTLAGVQVGFGSPVRIMGVINVSPESFYRSSIQNKKTVAQAARRMEEEGADFIDVGAMSTAPYLKTEISELEETERLEWAVKIIRKNCRLPISVDSMRSFAAESALKAGGDVLNDVSGFQRDSRMPAVARNAKGVILMAHPDGINSLPGLPQKKNRWDPIILTQLLLRQSLRLAQRHSIPQNQIVLDPGIGFFRNLKPVWWEWDLEILGNLRRLLSLKKPLLVGLSRKSFIGHLLGKKTAEGRLYGSLGATIQALDQGASIIRTHDVGPTREAVVLAEEIRKRRKVKKAV